MSKGKSKIKQEEEHERTYTLPHPNQTPSQTHQPKKPNTNTPHSYKNIYQKKPSKFTPTPKLPSPIRRRNPQPPRIQPDHLGNDDLARAFGEDDVGAADEFDGAPDQG